MTNLYIEPKFDNILNSKQSVQKCLVFGQKLQTAVHMSQVGVKFLKQSLSNLRYGITCSNHDDCHQCAHKLFVESLPQVRGNFIFNMALER